MFSRRVSGIWKIIFPLAEVVSEADIVEEVKSRRIDPFFETRQHYFSAFVSSCRMSMMILMISGGKRGTGIVLLGEKANASNFGA